MSLYNFKKGLASKPMLVHVDEISNLMDDPDKDYYQSIFKYTAEHQKILIEKGSLAGIKDVKTDILYFDFDNKEDIEQARKDAIEVVYRLIEATAVEDSIEVFFSGAKGFGVMIHLNEELTPDQFKEAINYFAKDLKTFDPVVCDPQRVIRYVNSKHNKSGLFKIPLELSELDEMNVDEIKELAKKPRYNTIPKTQISIYSDMILPEKKKEKVKAEKPKAQVDEWGEVVDSEYSMDIKTCDLKIKPNNFDDARWLLNNGFFSEGERSTALLCLASFYKSIGYAKEQTYRLLKGTAELQSKRSGQDRFPDVELWNNVVSQVYGPNWKGGIFSYKDPNSWLYKYATKHGINVNQVTSVMKFEDIEAQFRDFVINIDKNTVKTGIRQLDEAMPLTVGMACGLVGAASSGKTSVALDILANTSKMNVTSVFASLDMYRTRIFEKLTYRVTGGKSRKEIYEAFQQGKHAEITQKIKDQFGNVFFYDRSSPTVQNIKDYVIDVQQKTGEKVKLVMIDYFERVSSEMSDDTAASKQVAGEIQDLVNDLNVCVVVLFQPNKQALSGGPEMPILNYASIKGSSFVFQSLRTIFSIWRPFFTPLTKEKDHYLSLGILKNDLGVLDTFDFGWEGKTGRIYELEDFQREELKELLDQRDKKKKEKDDEWK